MKRVLLYVILIIVSIFDFFYCMPIPKDAYIDYFYVVTSDVFFTIGLYLVVENLLKKNKLHKLYLHATSNIYNFLNLIVFIYSSIAVFAILFMVVGKEFAHAGHFIGLILSIEVRIQIKRMLKAYEYDKNNSHHVNNNI